MHAISRVSHEQHKPVHAVCDTATGSTQQARPKQMRCRLVPVARLEQQHKRLHVQHSVYTASRRIATQRGRYTPRLPTPAHQQDPSTTSAGTKCRAVTHVWHTTTTSAAQGGGEGRRPHHSSFWPGGHTHLSKVTNITGSTNAIQNPVEGEVGVRRSCDEGGGAAVTQQGHDRRRT